jgi:hypothetical protein
MRPLVATLVLLLAACPKGLDEGGPRLSPARVPADATAVLRLADLARAQEALRMLAPAGEGGVFGDAGRTLHLLLGEAPDLQRAAGLVGLAPRGEVLLSFRPSGEVLLALPVARPAAYEVALGRLLGIKGTRPGERIGGTRVWREADGTVALLERPIDAGSLLWPAPDDTLAAAALLDAMARGGPEGWPGGEAPATSEAAAELFAQGAFVARVFPALASALGGAGAVSSLHGELSSLRGELRLLLTAELAGEAERALAASFAQAGEAPRPLCALKEGAVAAVRVPVAWLREGEGDVGPLGHLEGQLAVALYPRAPGRPAWALVGDPAGLVGKQELEEAVRAAAGEADSTLQVGGRAAAVLRASQGPALLSVVDEDLFLLALDAEGPIRAALEPRAPCVAGEPPGAPAWLLLRPDALRAALGPAKEDDEGLGGDAISALRRLADRFLVGAEVVEGHARLEGRHLLLEVRAR